MDIKQSFGKALRIARKSKSLSQEDFSDTSSRTYLSSLERELKSPTLEKIDGLAGRMGIHPMTLLTLTYLAKDGSADLSSFLKLIEAESTIVIKAATSRN